MYKSYSIRTFTHAFFTWLWWFFFVRHNIQCWPDLFFFPTNQTFHQFHDFYTELDLHRIMSGFHGAFATGVASQQGTLTLPDTWFRPPFWDLLMLQLLRPNSSNLPCLYSTFHFEYPLVLSRFCFCTEWMLIRSKYTNRTRYDSLVVLLTNFVGCH